VNKIVLNNHAKIKKLQRLSPIWLIPIVAASIGLWMVVTTLHNQGPLITLELDNAEGIEPGKTPIKARSVEVGKVQTVILSEDLKHVTVTARMNVEAEPLLRQDTRFWVVKPRVGKSGISGLNTLLSGAYIELQPGKGKDSQQEFTVLDTPPVTPMDAPGLRIELSSELDNALSIGDPVLYRGFTVGRVEQAEFKPDTRQMNYLLFIQAPYDTMVTSNSRFWLNSGIQLQAATDGIKFKTGTLETILSGGVSFGVPPGWDLGQPVKNHRQFNLYADEDSSTIRRYQDRVDYILLFDESVRGLNPGAPVEYRGIQVGSVLTVPFSVPDNDLLTARSRQIPVLIRIEPGRIRPDMDKDQLPNWEREFTTAVKQGLRASLRSGNLLTGALYVDLNFYPDLPKVTGLGSLANYHTLPTASGGLARIEQQVVQLLNKLNQLNIEQVLARAQTMLTETEAAMANVRQVSASMDKIANQQSSQQLPAELKKTLAEMQKTLQGLSANSPAYGEMNRSIQSLNRVLREVQPMARTLSEKPNALLFQPDAGNDPEPRKAE
jgi:paraquat-inducible protein B